jgi:hypothetical protein
MISSMCTTLGEVNMDIWEMSKRPGVGGETNSIDITARRGREASHVKCTARERRQVPPSPLQVTHGDVSQPSKPVCLMPSGRLCACCCIGWWGLGVQ